MKTLICLLMLATGVFPHEGKDYKKEKTVKANTCTIGRKDTIAVNGY